MQTEPQEEYDGLTERAMKQLRKGDALERPGVESVFQMLVAPSFATCFVVDVCRNHLDDQRYVAVRRAWHSMVDYERAFAPSTPSERLRNPRPLSPTIETQVRDLETSIVDTALEELKAIRIPPFVEPEAIGTDGTQYELAFGSLFAGARYQWREEPPISWAPLNDWLRRTLKRLREEWEE